MRFYLADILDSKGVPSGVLEGFGGPLLDFGIPWCLGGFFLLSIS